MLARANKPWPMTKFRTCELSRGKNEPLEWHGKRLCHVSDVDRTRLDSCLSISKWWLTTKCLTPGAPLIGIYSTHKMQNTLLNSLNFKYEYVKCPKPSWSVPDKSWAIGRIEIAATNDEGLASRRRNEQSGRKSAPGLCSCAAVPCDFWCQALVQIVPLLQLITRYYTTNWY